MQKHIKIVKCNKLYLFAYNMLNVAIVIPKDTDETALTINGKKKKITRSAFILLGQSLGLNNKQIDGVFKRMNKNKSVANTFVSMK